MTDLPELGTAGLALWRDLGETEDGPMEMRPDERAILTEACRAADRIAELREVLAVTGPVAVGSRDQPIVHPALTEERLQRDLLGRLLARLVFEDEEEGEAVTVSQNARRAAHARWDKRGAR